MKRKPQIFTQKSRNRRGLLVQGIPKVFTSNDLVQQTVFTLHQFLGQVSIVYSYIGNIGSDTSHEEGEEREEDKEDEKEDEKEEVGEEGKTL